MNRRVALVQAPAFDWATPSNGIALVAAHLKAAGFRPSVHDASMRLYRGLVALRGRDYEHFPEFAEELETHPCAPEMLDREAERVAAGDPAVVGFSVLTHTERWSLELASRVKRLKPGCRVVFGGSQCLREALADDFIRHPDVDAVAVGEADLSIVGFLEALADSPGRVPAAAGILAKIDGRVVDGGEPPVVEDLDSLPFLDFSGYAMDDYSGDRIHLSASRGCVRKCSFCTHILQQKTYRLMSPRRVVAEIRHQMRLYPKRCLVEFTDSLINGNVRELAELADRLIDYRAERVQTHPGLDFGWTAMAILHPTMTPALLRKLRWSGCRHLRYGMESGSQKIVDAMRKNFRVADAEDVIRNTHRAGIDTQLFILVGFPGETEDDFRQTLGFIERNAAFLSGGVMISRCEIQKGSHLDAHAARYGIRLPIEDRVRWVSDDGANTFELRCDRVQRAHDLLNRQGLLRKLTPERVGRFTALPA